MIHCTRHVARDRAIQRVEDRTSVRCERQHLTVTNSLTCPVHDKLMEFLDPGHVAFLDNAFKQGLIDSAARLKV